MEQKALLTGQPTWSNLISLYYTKKPIFGLANFPKMEKLFLVMLTKHIFKKKVD